MKEAQPVTHIGTGQARVEKIASNRRVVRDGKVSYGRGSRSGSNEFHANAPEGLIDPFLKTISFWNGDTPLVELHEYATHPMSAATTDASSRSMSRAAAAMLRPASTTTDRTRRGNCWRTGCTWR